MMKNSCNIPLFQHSILPFLMAFDRIPTRHGTALDGLRRACALARDILLKAAALVEPGSRRVHNCAGTSASVISIVSTITMLITSMDSRFSRSEFGVPKCSINISFVVSSTFLTPTYIHYRGLITCTSCGNRTILASRYFI